MGKVLYPCCLVLRISLLAFSPLLACPHAVCFLSSQILNVKLVIQSNHFKRGFNFAYTGWPRNNGTVDTVDFSGLCSNQQLFSLPCWIEYLFPIIITPRSSNMVENFFFMRHFLWTVIFVICPISRVSRHDDK